MGAAESSQARQAVGRLGKVQAPPNRLTWPAASAELLSSSSLELAGGKGLTVLRQYFSLRALELLTVPASMVALPSVFTFLILPNFGSPAFSNLNKRVFKCTGAKGG